MKLSVVLEIGNVTYVSALMAHVNTSNKFITFYNMLYKFLLEYTPNLFISILNKIKLDHKKLFVY